MAKTTRGKCEECKSEDVAVRPMGSRHRRKKAVCEFCRYAITKDKVFGLTPTISEQIAFAANTILKRIESLRE